MAILATPYPIGLSQLQRSPMYNTDITVGKSGREVRNANWQDPLYKYNAASGIKTRADLATLEAFFHTVRGKENGFLLQDYQDYAIPQSGSTPQSIGTGDGSDLTWQIYKRYTNAIGGTYDRTITRPSATAADLVVFVNGVQKTNPTHYGYSSTTGIITFTGGNAPPNGHAVTITLAKFYVPVRFDTDELPSDLIAMWLDSGTPYSVADLLMVPLIEIRE